MADSASIVTNVTDGATIGSTITDGSTINTVVTESTAITSQLVSGAKGDKGDTGATGSMGPTGAAATIAVGTVTTGAAGSSVAITNAGTSSAAVFNFAIPKGDTGASGSGTGDMLSTNNLSDLTNATIARTNLGLGTLATQSGTFSGTSSGTNTGDQTNISGTALNVTGVVAVVNGGSGRATATTAYGLIAAGTTATGTYQTVSPGTSGYILRSNGVAALPTFQLGTKTDVGLANVDNTSDATKQTAFLAAAYPIGSIYRAVTSSLPSTISAIGIWAAITTPTSSGATTVYAQPTRGYSVPTILTATPIYEWQRTA